MQTLSIQVRVSYIQNFMNYVNEHNGKMRLLTQEESDNEIELFFKELENN